jgi:hypothetical protein
MLHSTVNSQNTRIRLDTTCIDIRNANKKVVVSYIRAGVPHRIDAKHAIWRASTWSFRISRRSCRGRKAAP